MKTNIIVDIDGTCSNASHRQYLVDGSGPKDWDRFYDMVPYDTPHTDILAILVAFTRRPTYASIYDFVYMTGRVERVRTVTNMWLRHHGFPQGVMLMRPDGDTTPDYELKRRLARGACLTPMNTLFVLDDRAQVVRMWRQDGFRCLQVAEGDF